MKRVKMKVFQTEQVILHFSEIKRHGIRESLVGEIYTNCMKHSSVTEETDARCLGEEKKSVPPAISKSNKINLFNLGNVRNGCPISRAKGSCTKRASIPDRIGI